MGATTQHKERRSPPALLTVYDFKGEIVFQTDINNLRDGWYSKPGTWQSPKETRITDDD